MICVTCKTGQYKEGQTTVILTIDETSVIIKEVPALVCDQCGEYILSSEITRHVLDIAREARSKGTEVEIRKFAA
jgi:YgiT-type zinc finger domain-containing protein